MQLGGEMRQSSLILFGARIGWIRSQAYAAVAGLILRSFKTAQSLPFPRPFNTPPLPFRPIHPLRIRPLKSHQRVW